MKWLPLLVMNLLGFVPQYLHGQNISGRLKAQVVDSTQTPVHLASVQLYKTAQANQVVRQALTNREGRFELETDTGTYLLTITHAGYRKETFPIQIKNAEVTATFVLSAIVKSLQNVTVTGKRPLIEQSDDKIIYNVENDPAAKAENATDILRKTPLVTVDGEGNVQLNGQSNFRILMNGRETSMFAMNVKEALKGFPGAVISRIEVITSPSAKWDAEGVGGIINIITRKKVIGYNGYLSSYYSTLSNYSESASINLKSGKLGVSGYAGGSGSVNNIRSGTISETTPFQTAAFTRRALNGEREGRNLGSYGNIELVYEWDSLHTIATYGNLGRYRGTSLLLQDIVTDFLAQPSQLSFLQQDNTSRNGNAGVGADLIRKFPQRPDKELSFRFNGQFSRNEGLNTSLQDQWGQERFVNNTSFARNRELTAQADLVQPLQRKMKWEMGIKGILRKASSDYQSLVKYAAAEAYKANPANSDKFRYHQEVYSLYSSLNFSVKKTNFRTGLRVEHTEVGGDFVSSKTTVNQRYTNLVPNLLASHKFSPIYTLTGTYNLRLQRPYITSLNPFVNNNDSFNITFGNPDLGPQVLHAVSLQNRYTKGKFFAAFTVNGSYTNNLIVQYAFFDPATGVTATTSANVGREWQTGGALSMSTPIGQKLNVGMNTQLRYNQVENTSNLLQRREGFSGAAFFNFNYRAVGKFTISGSGGVTRSPYTLVNSPGTQAFYQVNFGYKFLKDKLAVTMNVNNVHDQHLRFRMVTANPDFRVVTTNITPYRVIFFGATYSFGKLKENISKKKGVANDDLVQ